MAQALCFKKETELLLLRIEMILEIINLNSCLFYSNHLYVTMNCHECSLVWKFLAFIVGQTECPHTTNVLGYDGNFVQHIIK